MRFDARNHLAAVALFLWIVVPAEANAQDQRRCDKIESYAASFIERCGDRLRSFTLSLKDVRRTTGSDLHGRFYFECSIELLCVSEPEISGWFIDAKSWASSSQDQEAVLDVLRQASVMGAAWGQPGGRGPKLPESLCQVFDVQIAGLSGRVVCYAFPDMKSSALVAISADADVGFVLVFYQRNLDLDDLRKRALSMMSRLSIERASGDAALLRWMK
jgi:hypothetical protein